MRNRFAMAFLPILLSGLLPGLLLTGCVAAGPVGLAATALSVVAAAAGPKPPGHLDIDPNRGLSEALSPATQGQSLACLAILERDRAAAPSAAEAEGEPRCALRPVCLRGQPAPVSVLVCAASASKATADAATGAGGQTEAGRWDWNTDSAATPR